MKLPAGWRAFVLERLGLLLLVIVMGATGCSDDDQPAVDAERAPGAYVVVTTTGMIADIAQRIAGDRATVTGLIGAGVDPHLYKPTRSDIVKIMEADLVFYNGLLLEGRMTDAFIRAATAGRKVYPVTQLLGEEYLLEPAEFKGHYDPHVWMDPLAWKEAVQVIRDKLTEFDPTAGDLYAQRAKEYREQLDRIHAYAAKTLASVPKSSQILVTAHDAFNYFGRRYGYEVVGIQGLSTDSEAGVKDIERIVDLLVARQVRAVFVESTVSERNIRALVNGAGARDHAVEIGGKLFSDAMGTPGSYEGTYVGMIDHNVTLVVRALGGEAPERGMQGLLGKKVEK